MSVSSVWRKERQLEVERMRAMLRKTEPRWWMLWRLRRVNGRWTYVPRDLNLGERLEWERSQTRIIRMDDDLRRLEYYGQLLGKMAANE